MSKNKYEDPPFGGRSQRKTRKSVKANHPGEKLVTITNDTTAVERVRVSVARALVATGQWRYCPKKFKLETVNP